MTTIEASKATRKTTANSAFLRECKRAFNGKVYKACLDLTNGPEGEAGARAYLLKNFVRSLGF